MELQLVFEVWDSLDGWNGRCLNQLGGKTHEQIERWKSSCRCCPVLPMEGDFWLWDVWVLQRSCFWLKRVWEICSKCFHKFLWDDLQVLMSFAYFLYMKQKWEVVCNRPVQAIQHLVTYNIGPFNLWIWLATRDLGPMLKDCGLT